VELGGTWWNLVELGGTYTALHTAHPQKAINAVDSKNNHALTFFFRSL
jgi:hypothetical protein